MITRRRITTALFYYLLIVPQLVLAQNTNQAKSAVDKGGDIAASVVNFLIVLAMVVGLGLVIGGLLHAYNYFKTDGNKGSMGGGVGMAVIGVITVLITGFIIMMGHSLGIDNPQGAIPVPSVAGQARP